MKHRSCKLVKYFHDTFTRLIGFTAVGTYIHLHTTSLFLQSSIHGAPVSVQADKTSLSAGHNWNSPSHQPCKYIHLLIFPVGEWSAKIVLTGFDLWVFIYELDRCFFWDKLSSYETLGQVVRCLSFVPVQLVFVLLSSILIFLQITWPQFSPWEYVHRPLACIRDPIDGCVESGLAESEGNLRKAAAPTPCSQISVVANA